MDARVNLVLSCITRKHGEIYDVLLEKRSGRIAYAVLAFGGFLGIGERYHSLPWATLKYDTRQGGYVVGLTIDQVKGLTNDTAEGAPFGDPALEARVPRTSVSYWGA